MSSNPPNAFHRKSIRLRGYDYRQAGVYFTTICTYNHECLLGEIIEGAMCINEWGRVVESEWLKTSTVRRGVILDAFVVMPNNFHGIVVLNEEIGATHRVASTSSPYAYRATHRVAPTSGLTSASLGALIGQFKSKVTKSINALRCTPGAPFWQRNYHERIIRDEQELKEKRNYIRNNPAQWATDEENRER